MENLPMGTIIAFALSTKTIPTGWLLCDGSPIPKQYANLIIALNSNNTPNLTGRTLIGTGNNPSAGNQADGTSPNFPPTNNWTVGYTGGEYQHQLTVNELAAHSHTINKGNIGLHHRSFAGADGTTEIPFITEPSKPLSGSDSTGGSSYHNTMQPYYAINYIIYSGQNS